MEYHSPRSPWMDGVASSPTSPSTRPSSPLFLTPSDQGANSTSLSWITSTPEAETSIGSLSFVDCSDYDSGDTVVSEVFPSSSMYKHAPTLALVMPQEFPHLQTSTPIPGDCFSEMLAISGRSPRRSTGMCSTPPNGSLDEHDYLDLEEPLPKPKRRRLFTEIPQDAVHNTTSCESNTNSTQQSSTSSSQTPTPKGMYCCPRNCLQSMSPEKLHQARLSFNCRNQSEQRQFLLDAFQITNGDALHLVAGHQLCTNGFIKALGISRKRYRKIHIQFVNGSHKAFRKPPKRTVTEKTSHATAWMSNYFEKIADRMPHTGHLHLPQFLTKKDVYVIMQRELLGLGMQTVSIQHFYAIWNKKFKHVTIPEVHKIMKELHACVLSPMDVLSSETTYS